MRYLVTPISPRFIQPVGLRGLSGPGDYLDTSVTLTDALPWLLVGGLTIWAVSALAHRPRRKKKRKTAKPPIVVGRGVGVLGISGLIALGVLGGAAITKATGN